MILYKKTKDIDGTGINIYIKVYHPKVIYRWIRIKINKARRS